MRFLAPEYLIWAAVLAPIALLFLVRPRARTVRVSSLSLFEASDAGARPLRAAPRLRRLLAFLLAAATVLLTVGALARLTWAPEVLDGDVEKQAPPGGAADLTEAHWAVPHDGPDPFTRTAVYAACARIGLSVSMVLPSTERSDALVLRGRGAIVFDPRPPQGSVIDALPAGGRVIDHLIGIDEHHPVLAGVASDRVILNQVAVLPRRGSARVLWEGPHGPVLTAETVDGLRVVTMAFSPRHAPHLGLTASYPVLVANAIDWVLQAPAPTAAGIQRAGTDASDLPSPLLWLVLGLLVVEAWLFHRRGWL